MRFRYKCIFVIFLGLIILNLIFVSSSNNNSKIKSEVYKDLTNKNKTKVIIELKKPDLYNGVIFKKNKTNDDIEKNKRDIKSSIKKKIDKNKIKYEFDGYITAEVDLEDIKTLQQNENITSIWPSIKLEALLQDSTTIINATNTWKLQANSINLTGIGETICELDTGINFSHQDLIGKNKTSCLIDCLGQACSQNCSRTDDHGHGTHVAGIIGASPKIYGVAINVSLIGVKVLYSDGSGDFSEVANGINWCIDNAETYNISVITMSLGTNCNTDPNLCYSSYCDSQSVLIAPAIDEAISKNISVIIASGNNGNTSKISFPACVKNATAVGATNKSDSIWGSSNRNSLIDFVAPGVNINSTKKSGGYEIRDGTSMAAPHVAGAFAIINQLYKLERNRTATPFEIQNLFNLTGKLVYDSLSNLNYTRIDVYSAVLFSDTISPSVTINSSILEYIGSIVNVSFNCSSTDWQLSNTTLYIWNLSNNLIYSETKNISGIRNSSLFYNNLSTGEYFWNCRVSDTNGNSAYSLSNNSLILESMYVTLQTPTNFSLIKNSSIMNSTNFTCNSFSSTNQLKNISLNIWNSSNSIIFNESKNISGFSNSSTFFYNITLEGNYSWNCILYNNESNYTTNNYNYSLIYDITKPEISILENSIESDQVTISFSTNEGCNHTVYYGLDENLGNNINSNNIELSHSSTISDLSSSTVYYYNISYCDYVGNCITNGTYSFTTSAVSNPPSGGSGGGGGGGSGDGSTLYLINNNESLIGTTKLIQQKDRLKLNINEKEHSIILAKVNNNDAIFTIMSDPFNISLNIGQEIRLNLTSPNYYDLLLKLIDIKNNKTNLSIKAINETILKNNNYSIENDNSERKLQINSNQTNDNFSKQKTNLFFLKYILFGIFIGVIVVLIVIFISFSILNSNKEELNNSKKRINYNIKTKQTSKK